MIANIMAETPFELSRLGHFTASKIDALLTEPKTKEAKEKGELSEAAKTYIHSRASEIVTGTVRQVSNWALDWGNSYEPIAASLLKDLFPEMQYMGKESPTFFQYTDLSGGSPDGIDLVNKLIFEIKCPEDPANHVEYCLLEAASDLKKVEREYYHQMQFNMMCVAKAHGFDFFDMRAVFASYSPIVNEPYMKLKLIVVEPDKQVFDKLNYVIPKAEIELAKIIYALSRKSIPPFFVARQEPELGTMIVENGNLK